MVLDVREILRRVLASEGDRAIARDLAVSRKTVARYRTLAHQHGWLSAPLLTTEELYRRLSELSAAPPPRTPYKAAAYREVIEGLRRAQVEMRAIHQRLCTEHGFTGSYSALYRYVRHLEGERDREAFVRLETPAGEEAQVDFGYAGLQVDPATGKRRKAWVFVMTLSCSRHQYAVLVFDQRVSTWLRCHREAFEWFGGVPRRIVIDNLKAAITKACHHDPVVQRSYREFAEHYGFLIAPCRPRTPRHKGKVESGVHYVSRNFLAGREFRDIIEANAQLLIWITDVAGVRIHGTTRHRPLEVFEQTERQRLLPLPTSPYDMGVWKRLKLHRDCHVVLDGAYYSAPHRLVGQTLWVRGNGQQVVVFHDYERIATHRWGPPGTRRTIDSHYPPHKVAVLRATPQACRDRATQIGPATLELTAARLDDRVVDRRHAARALLRLGDRYGEQRLEAACRRALCFGDTDVATVRRILQKGLEAEPVAEEALVCTQSNYAFARPGSEIFVGG
jgi:transposase